MTAAVLESRQGVLVILMEKSCLLCHCSNERLLSRGRFWRHGSVRAGSAAPRALRSRPQQHHRLPALHDQSLDHASGAANLRHTILRDPRPT